MGACRRLAQRWCFLDEDITLLKQGGSSGAQPPLVHSSTELMDQILAKLLKVKKWVPRAPWPSNRCYSLPLLMEMGRFHSLIEQQLIESSHVLVKTWPKTDMVPAHMELTTPWRSQVLTSYPLITVSLDAMFAHVHTFTHMHFNILFCLENTRDCIKFYFQLS